MRQDFTLKLTTRLCRENQTLVIENLNVSGMLANRWYPSSKLCSRCGARYGMLTLGERAWRCEGCGAHHDRDVNAAINLQRLATSALGANSATRG